MSNLLRLLTSALFVVGLQVGPAPAQDNLSDYDAEISSAKRSILEGHVKDGIGQLAALGRKIDPTKEPEAYWRINSSLAEFLHQTENYTEESQILASMMATNIVNSNSIHFQPMQLMFGRNLAYTGKSDDGEKMLRALTGGDARWVLTPLQRSAARVLSTIEFDRGNIGQAAIWMRRAVIGAMIDKGASSEEVVDTLTDYATYLRRIRQLPEANSLLLRLATVYNGAYPLHSPKFLHYASEFLQTLRVVDPGAADLLYRNLKDNAAAVDFVAASVREQLFYQDLYGSSVKSPVSGEPSVSSRLEQLTSRFPDWVKQTEPRIAFSYFALLAGDVELADKFVTAASSGSLTPQFAAYQLILKSYIAARREQFPASSDLLEAALKKITSVHQSFANEYASRLPTISFEERLVLSAILSRLAVRTLTPEQANVVFQLQQFLNRDKSKLSLSTKVARQALKSDLLREDVRSRDRIKDLRERIMNEATEKLLARTLPIKEYAPSKDNDPAFLTRLEDVEERIANTDAELSKSTPDYYQLSSDNSVELADVQRLLKPNEALVAHVALVGKGLVAACVTSDKAIFDYKVLTPSELQQLVVDAKLVSAALRGTHEPSVEQDSGFPAENSFRLYQAFLGDLEACLKGKNHILLATDADFLTLPWNALLLERPDGREFHHREAKWLPRTYALSLLPSVGSLRQLRRNLPASQAHDKFLGVGDPDFKGEPERSTQIALASVFNARGAANREAIASLPRLPETAAELNEVASALGATSSVLLLGRDATERGLRSRSLENYRVISFATHAVVAGEIEGATEPALILSPGEDQNNSKNDGLLTANEIADLSLDANLVILSACNTAAPDGRLGGRGLSGLADAFFFAGARAVAVTQWAVYSDAAQRIGAGLVARSVGSDPVGVAEGLRRTMVDFIDTAKQDYLAHPRFWASYIIAGDGAVSPLEGMSEADDKQKPIRPVWEHIFSGFEQADIMGLAKTADQKTDYAIGVEAPPSGEKRAGSYIASVDTSGSIEVLGIDREMAASGIAVFDGKIGITGFYPSSCTTCPQQPGNSSAVFRLVNSDGRELWKNIHQSSQSIFAIGMVKASQGYILIAFETDYSPASKPSHISLTLVSELGTVLSTNRFVIPLKLPTATRSAVQTSDGNVVVAVNGETGSSAENPIWMDPLTGTKRFSCGRHSAVLFFIDPETMAVRQQTAISDEGTITRLKESGGKLYASVSFGHDCRFLEKNVRLVEVDRDFTIRTIFESNSVNGVEISDFEVTPKAFVLVGRVYSFLPRVLANQTMSLERSRHFQMQDLRDEFWDQSDSIANGLILVVGRDGNAESDKVFYDVRNRGFSRVVANETGRFIAAGSALGDHGWIVGFTLADRWH